MTAVVTVSPKPGGALVLRAKRLEANVNHGAWLVAYLQQVQQ
jgi:hypothetical protein